MKKRPLRRWLLIACVPLTIVGLFLIGTAGYLYNVKSDQIVAYNQGVASYQSLQLDEALAHFDKSLAAYEQATGYAKLWKFVVAPDRGTASRAAHHKANILVRMKRFKEAVSSIELSLRLNPGENYDMVRDFDRLTVREIDELAEQALTTKNVFELLMKSEAIRKRVKGN